MDGLQVSYQDDGDGCRRILLLQSSVVVKNWRGDTKKRIENKIDRLVSKY